MLCTNNKTILFNFVLTSPNLTSYYTYVYAQDMICVCVYF